MAAQNLYGGDYMEEDIYADWCAEEREQLREIYLEALSGMADCHAARGHYAEAVQVCRTALARDPCKESFQRALMEHLVRLGRGDWAVAQYRRFEGILAQELGVEPMPETQRLYRQILDVEGRTPANKKIGRRSEE
jgi:DNA-binding SARP family transcriptional activator